jgi:hypothetical protein
MNFFKLFCIDLAIAVTVEPLEHHADLFADIAPADLGKRRRSACEKVDRRRDRKKESGHESLLSTTSRKHAARYHWFNHDSNQHDATATIGED